MLFSSSRVAKKVKKKKKVTEYLQLLDARKEECLETGVAAGEAWRCSWGCLDNGTACVQVGNYLSQAVHVFLFDLHRH